MNSQLRRFSLCTVLITLLVVLLGINRSAFPVILAQDATSQQQTINAVVNQRFTQTAQVQQQIAVTQTINAAFNSAVTATAAFQNTVDSASNRALTATSAPRATRIAQIPPIVPFNRKESRGLIGSVTYSPDGNLLAVEDAWGVSLYQTANPEAEPRLLKNNTGDLTSVAFSPDGRSLVSGGDDGTVRLWDVSSRKNIATLAGHTASVTSVTFSPDGRTPLVARMVRYGCGSCPAVNPLPPLPVTLTPCLV